MPDQMMQPMQQVQPMVPMQPPPAALVAEQRQQVQAGTANQEAMAEQAKQPLQTNPILDLYRRYSLQYEKDATEANKAARMYATMSQDLLKGPLQADVTGLTGAEMARIGVKTWGHAVWEFEKMLRENKGSLAAAAAAKASAKYNKAVADYTAAQQAYDSSAMGYSLRVGLDEALAKKLITYANQYRLQGNNDMADNYDNQATTLMGQAENMAATSKGYFNFAYKINGVIGGIQKMAGIAGTKAAWNVAPVAPVPQSHLFPFTPVPPLEFAQMGESTKVVHQRPNEQEQEMLALNQMAPVPPAPKPSSSFLGRD